MWGRMYLHAVLLIFTNIVLKVSCKGSLTFLIDDTFSMTDDINQVRRNVDRISDAVFNEKSSLIENMVLVTFNDPDAQVRVKTQNRDSFKRTLEAVYAHNDNNPDCWEPSMNGLLLALEQSNSNSYIYVFTDAPARDYKDGHFVKELCQKKQTQIVFVLTGRCGDRHAAKAFDVYFDIAQACSGLAFNVDKTDVEQVIRAIEESIKGNKTVITSTTVPAGVKKHIPFIIDDHTDYAIVSVAGRNVDLSIKGPSVPIKKMMWNKNGKILKLSKAKPGKYVVTVMGKSKTSVIIVGRTDFFFTHGFSKLKPKSLGDTSLQPIADTNLHLSISVTDDHNTVQILSAQILDMNEKPMNNPMTLTEISKHFYVTNPFVAPSRRFKIAVKGVVKATGKSIKRIVKIPITPSEPTKVLPTNTKPTVNISEGEAIEIEFNSTVQLTCKVVAFPEPKIEWINNKERRVPSEMSLQEYPNKYISYMDISYASKGDKYKCYAVNDVGRDEATIDVFVKEPFTVKSTPPEITKFTYGTEGTVTCDVTSRLPIDIHWYYANGMTGEAREIETSDKFEISASRTQLKIKKMDLDFVGRYICKVSLKNNTDVQKSFSTRVNIDGLILPTNTQPTVKISEGEAIEIEYNSTVKLTCTVVAFPEPKIEWIKNNGGRVPSKMSLQEYPNKYVSYMDISYASERDRYKCYAVNDVGRDEAAIDVFVKEPFAVEATPPGITKFTYGTEGTLTCNHEIRVPLNIHWYYANEMTGDEREIETSDKFEISARRNQLKIKKITLDSVGRYACDVSLKNKNDVMYANGFISFVNYYYVDVSFSTRVKIDGPKAPKVSGVTAKKVRLGMPASIECTIEGEPKPTITWKFNYNSGSKFLRIPGSDKVLNFPRVEYKHAGNYKCVATNEIGSNEHITTLVVEFAPEIINNAITVEGIEGDLALKIPCEVVGNPKPVVTWKLKGATITPDAKYTIEDGALVIKEPTEKDSSLYTCEAINYIGTTSTTVQATVKKSMAAVWRTQIFMFGKT